MVLNIHALAAKHLAAQKLQAEIDKKRTIEVDKFKQTMPKLFHSYDHDTSTFKVNSKYFSPPDPYYSEDGSSDDRDIND